MHKYLFLPAVSLLMIFSGMFLSCSKLSSPMPDAQLKPYQACASASDCVYVINGCCNCVNGGDEVAVNTLMLEDFSAQFDCSKVACTLMERIPPCGSGTVSCENQLCKYQLP